MIFFYVVVTEVFAMADYKRMYALLCRAVDDAIDALEIIPEAARVAEALQTVLYQAEEIYIENSDEQRLQY